MSTHQHHPLVAERGGDGRALIGSRDQLGGVVEVRQSLAKEHRVVIEELESGVGGAEGGGIWGMEWTTEPTSGRAL